MMVESEEQEASSRGSLEFVERSVLDTIIPLASDLNMEEALTGSVERLDDGHDSPLAAISQRQALFFDETASIYVVLQTPNLDERTLRSYLGRLVINLEAQVVNAQPDNYDGPLGREVIYNGFVQDSDDPLIVVQGPDESQESPRDGHILVVWKLAAFLMRPRLRLQNPSIVFSATANLKPPEQVQSGTLKEEYLPSQIPSGMNLLESFSGDPALGEVKPLLSALRVSRVTPATEAARDVIHPLKNISRQSIRVYPAINARVRYSRLNTIPTNPSVIASLDVDITPFANCEIKLSTVDVKISGGNVDDLNDIPGMELPITCHPQDDITFLYRILPDEMDITNKSQMRTLEVTITATAYVSAVCTPQLSMQWTTSIDFTPPVNPGFGHATQPIQRSHRPSQLSIGSTFETIPTVSSLAIINRAETVPTVELTNNRHQRNSFITDFGVTMTFTAPSADLPIHPGIPFAWSVFIVNRSDRPRKLALLVIPKRRRAEPRISRPTSTNYAGGGGGGGGGSHDLKIADAVTDENIVHAMQRNAAIEPTDIICLSTDTRVGPLAPSACYEVELRFVALKVGIVTVEAVRVVDLGSNEHVDIKDLPSIIIVEPATLEKV